MSQIGEIGMSSKDERPTYNPQVITLDLDKPEFDGWFTEKSELTKEQQYYKKIFTEN